MGVALRRSCRPKHVSQPGVGISTDYPQHRSTDDRICVVVSALSDRFIGLGLPYRPSIRRTLQFPLWDRTHSRVSTHGRRHRGFLVSVSPGETVAGMAWHLVTDPYYTLGQGRHKWYEKAPESPRESLCEGAIAFLVAWCHEQTPPPYHDDWTKEREGLYHSSLVSPGRCCPPYHQLAVSSVVVECP